MNTLLNLKNSKVFKYTKKLFIVILASFISAVALNIFIIPHKFLSGGVSGIALIVQYLGGFQAGYFILLANIPLFILSIKYIDKEFTVFNNCRNNFSGIVFATNKKFISLFYS